ncbi:34284_t:CDS:2, partial [Racocetra persica]
NNGARKRESTKDAKLRRKRVIDANMNCQDKERAKMKDKSKEFRESSSDTCRIKCGEEVTSDEIKVVNEDRSCGNSDAVVMKIVNNRNMNNSGLNDGE